MRATRMTAAALAACLTLAALGAVAAEARTDNRSKPIVFVHGLDAFGEAGVDCASTWNTMSSRLGQFGHSGTKATIAYYGGDTNCTNNLGLHGSHSTHYPRTDAHTSTGGRHDMDGDIRHLGYHLAWTIYNTWSRNGVTVDAVGHSMGGLILRYALHRIQANDSQFPPYLYVEDVVTLGTPHLGSGWASGCTWAYECVQMENGSSFVNYLNTYAKNPQADGGTDWSLVSSYDDGIVSEGSGTGDSAAKHKVQYLGSMNLGHSDYMGDTSDTRDADVRYQDLPDTAWYSWYSAPHAVRWSDFALTYGSW